MTDYGLSRYDAAVLVAERETADYFEEMAKGREPKLAASWLTGTVFSYLNEKGIGISASSISASANNAILGLLSDGTINRQAATQVFRYVIDTGKSPAEIVEEKGLRQVTDTGAIDAAVERILAANPGQVANYRGGLEKLFGFFVGQVMREMKGKGNPALVNAALLARLGPSSAGG